MIPGVFAASAMGAGGEVVPQTPFEELLLSHGPTGFWTLQETEGLTAVDSSGNANHGTYIGPAIFGLPPVFPDAGPRSVGLGHDAYITLPNEALISGSGPRTVGLLVNITQFDGTSFLVTWGEASNGRGWSIELGRNGDGSLGINMHGNGWFNTSDPGLFTTGEPLLLAAVYTGSRVRIYVGPDQVLDWARASANTVASAGAIGRRIYSADTPSGRSPTPGQYSHVFVIPKALTDVEVGDLYAALGGIGPPPPPPVHVESLWVGHIE